MMETEEVGGAGLCISRNSKSFSCGLLYMHVLLLTQVISLPKKLFNICALRRIELVFLQGIGATILILFITDSLLKLINLKKQPFHKV